MIEEKYIEKIEKIINKEIKKSEKGIEEWCDDNENLHVVCDEILKEFIKELGYKKIIKKYEEAQHYFWYA